MEDELGKASEGQDRLERAKDRLDTKVAEIGQAELDKQEDEQHADQAQGQQDNAEGNVDEAVEADPMEHGTPLLVLHLEALLFFRRFCGSRDISGCRHKWFSKSILCIPCPNCA